MPDCFGLFYTGHYIFLVLGMLVDSYKALLHNDFKVYKMFGVSSDNRICSRIGSDIMRKGGNAVDAAIGTEFCLCVVDVQATSIAGGGKMIIHMNKNRMSYALNFREVAPLNIKEIPKDSSFRRGVHSIAVPGSISGLYAAWNRFGTIKWQELIRPSIVLAKRGFRMNQHLHDCTKNVARHIRRDSYLSKILLRYGRIKRVGSIIRNPNLAKTLYEISKHPLSFYNETIASRILSDLKGKGSVFTFKDLSGYRSKWERPLKYEILPGMTGIFSPGKSGGPMIIFILKLFKKMRRKYAAKLRRNLKLQYQILTEIFKYSFAYRGSIFTNSNYRNNRLILSIAKKINIYKTFPIEHYLRFSRLVDPRYEGGTSHTSVIDKFGNAVAITTSINTQLGSFVTSESTGVLFNNQMLDFNTKDTKPNKLVQSKSNNMAPGREPFSSISPIIILNDGNVKMVTGASGGPLIITSLSQIIINVFFKKMDADDAIRRWRIHHQLSPNAIQYESNNLIPSSIRKYLQSKGHRFKPINKCRRSNSNSIYVLPETEGSEANIEVIGDFRKRSGVSGE